MCSLAHCRPYPLAINAAARMWLLAPLRFHKQLVPGMCREQILERKRREYRDLVPEYYDIEASDRSEDDNCALRQVRLHLTLPVTTKESLHAISWMNQSMYCREGRMMSLFPQDPRLRCAASPFSGKFWSTLPILGSHPQVPAAAAVGSKNHCLAGDCGRATHGARCSLLQPAKAAKEPGADPVPLGH